MRMARCASKESAWRLRRALIAVAFAVAAIGALANVASAGVSRSRDARATSGGTATFALPLAGAANYIFPMMSGAYSDPQNVQWFTYLFFRPLYMIGAGSSVTLDTALSLAYPPVYSNGDRTVTIRMKNYKWSTGAAVTARDVEFWENLVKANKETWFSYVPGYYPDNIASVKVLNATTIQFNLTKAYNTTWFTDNELSQITPLPQQVMDKTCATCKVGTDDLTTKGAVAVYKFISKQAQDEGTYTTNALWKAIDGPWRLTTFDPTTGHAVYKFNTSYSGPVAKNHITTFIEDTFTSSTAEYDEIRSNGLDYGYIPLTDATQSSSLTNYTSEPWDDMIVTYFVLNMNNPKVGAIFRQTYIRQVIQELIDQKGIIKAFYDGYGKVLCGPVPVAPSNPWVSSYEKSCPYGYNPQKAVKALKAHGWTVEPGGVSYCSKPSLCGSGISQGEKLEFTFLYATGRTAFDASLAVVKSDAEKAGIDYELKSATFGAVLGAIAPCGPGSVAPTASCNTEIADWGAGWGYQPDFYPTGELLFSTGAGSNYENYSNATANRLIAATLEPNTSQKSLDVYQHYMVSQIPVEWQPEALRQLSEIAKNLHGATPQSVEGDIFPENWSFST